MGWDGKIVDTLKSVLSVGLFPLLGYLKSFLKGGEFEYLSYEGDFLTVFGLVKYNTMED